MTLPNGPYAFYVDAKLPPIIVEIFYGYVYEVGEISYRPLGSYRGKFVKLIEKQEPDEAPHGFFAGTGELAYVPDAGEPEHGAPTDAD